LQRLRGFGRRADGGQAQLRQHFGHQPLLLLTHEAVGVGKKSRSGGVHRHCNGCSASRLG